MKKCYRTIRPPRSIVGGLPKPEYTGTGRKRERKLKRERKIVCVHACVCHSVLHSHA